MLYGKQSCKHSKQLSGSHNLRQEKTSLSPWDIYGLQSSILGPRNQGKGAESEQWDLNVIWALSNLTKPNGGKKGQDLESTREENPGELLQLCGRVLQVI